MPVASRENVTRAAVIWEDRCLKLNVPQGSYGKGAAEPRPRLSPVPFVCAAIFSAARRLTQVFSFGATPWPEPVAGIFPVGHGVQKGPSRQTVPAIAAWLWAGGPRN